MMEMATVHVVVMALWLVVWVTVLRQSRRLVRTPCFGTYVNRVGGVILMGLGVRTVVT